MGIYYLLFLLGLILGDFDKVPDASHVYVDAKILDTGFDLVEYQNQDVEIISDEEITEEVLEVQVGKLSRYGPDCYGCSGYLAYGDYVGDGTVFYNDSQYGEVRILAADRKYPFGTIVRVSTDDESFLTIVLDRGGAIGFGKIALFDLLYPSEFLAELDGVSYNTTFEILRYGF